MVTISKERQNEPGAGEPVKFLFDDEFGSRGEAGKKLAAAEVAAFNRGRAEGEAQANAKIERQLATALEQAAVRFSELGSRFASLETRLEVEAVEVALAVARKLAPALIEREPLAEIEALVIDVLAHVRTAPHVVVRVSEAMIEPAGEHLRRIAEQRGYTNRLVFLPAPELKNDEIRIEWADGGVTRDRDAVDSRIDEAVRNYLARGATAASGTGA